MTEVVWLTPGYPWAGDPTAGVFYRTQAQALARAGVDVTVVVPTPSAPWPLPRLRRRWAMHAAAPRLAADGDVTIRRPRYLNVPGEPSWARPDRWIADAAWRTRDAWRGAGLVHGHYAITGIAARRVADRAGLPLILTFHGSDMNTWPDQRPERRRDLAAAVRDARAVIAVSAALADRVEALTGVRPIHLPLGSDVAGLRAAAVPRDAARRALGLGPSDIVAMFVGHLKASKGVRVFVDGVLAAGPGFLGVLVGDGPESGYGLDRPGASGRIRYAGPQPHDRVPGYLSAADALVLPSFSEGLPTVIVEAGALERPVIASAVGGIPELLADDRGVLLPEVSAAAVAAALRAQRDDPGAAAGRAGRLAALVTTSYDVDANAARLRDLYRRVIEPSS